MDVNRWLTVLFGAPVLIFSAWQIGRDLRKDRKEQERAAQDRAVRDALLEERLRHLEEHGDDDDA